VQIGRDGECISVGADESIIDALLDAGYDPLFDCKRGECGMCAVGVIAGEPDHRDGNLSDAEKAFGKIMCICVSRAHGERLVLDL
jgi:vanillate O-demethylase ferredoxin subunit